MGKVIVVTSGKGGVGKTTTTASLGLVLAEHGFRVVVIDFDVGLRNLDLLLGCDGRIVYDLIDVIEGKAKVRQALVPFKKRDGLYLLASAQAKDKGALELESLGRVIDQLKEGFDYIICDSPAGIEHGALAAMHYADEAIVVVNPELSSVRDADRMIGLLTARSRRAELDLEPVFEWVMVTRYDPDRVDRGEMFRFEDVVNIISVPLLGVIPESQDVLNSANLGQPVAIEERSAAGQAYRDAVRRLRGEEVALRFVTPRSVLGRLFNRDFA